MNDKEVSKLRFLQRDSFSLFGQTIPTTYGREPLTAQDITPPKGQTHHNVSPLRVADAINTLSTFDFVCIPNLDGKLRHSIKLSPTDAFRNYPTTMGFLRKGIDPYYVPAIFDNEVFRQKLREYGVPDNAYFSINWTNAHLGAMLILIADKYTKEQVLDDCVYLDSIMKTQQQIHPTTANKPHVETLQKIAQMVHNHYPEDEGDAYNFFAIAYMGGLMEENYAKFILECDAQGNRISNYYRRQRSIIGRHGKYFIFFALLYDGDATASFLGLTYTRIVDMSIKEICDSTRYRNPSVVSEWIDTTIPDKYRNIYRYSADTLLMGTLEEIDLWQVPLEDNPKRYTTNPTECAYIANRWYWHNLPRIALPKESRYYIDALGI